MKKEKLLSSYGFSTVEEITAYVFESYINGQKKQAIEVWNEIKQAIDLDEVQRGLYFCIAVLGVFDVADIFSKIEPNETILENAIYNNYYNGFDKMQPVIIEAYDRNNNEEK